MVPWVVNSAGRLRFSIIYNTERVKLVATILHCIMLLAPNRVLLFRLSSLLNAIAEISNSNLIQMKKRLITEGSEWPENNLLIKSNGKGPRFISTIA